MIPWHAVITFHEWLLIAVISSLAYAFTLRRIADLVQPYRLRLAEQGEKYLPFCDTIAERRLISFYLDNAFNPWLTIWSSILFPCVVTMQVFKPENPDMQVADSGAHNEILCLFLFSAFAANPLFGVILILEIIIFSLPSILIAGNLALIRRAIRVFLNREAGGSQIKTPMRA